MTTSGPPTVSAAESADFENADGFGRVEQAGVEYLPEAARDSRPLNLFTVFFGGNLAFSVIIFGWLPITYGLSFWGAVSASAVGLVLGLVITAPLALLGPRTGTNNTVSSGAFFGIRGRFIGSGLVLLFALAYAAIAVWTSGDALVAASHRLLHLPDGNGALAIGYGLIAVEIVVVALFGHGTVIAMQRFVLPVVGVLLVLGVIAFWGPFTHASGVSATHGQYVVGGFWGTWTLSVAIAIGGPLSYAPTLGDYSRRISHRRFSDRSILLATCTGIFFGLLATAAFGAFTAVTFRKPSASYVADLVTTSPGWYVGPIVVIALAGGLGQGVLNVYASGLDLEAIFPKLNRVHTTLITSALAVALLYAGVFLVSAVDSITAMTLVLNAFAAPWVTILAVGHWMRHDSYNAADLQDFATGRRDGRYWFTGGWNLRAVIAFATGSAFGLLAVDTSLYTGPLAGLAGGVDLSVVGSALIAAVVYLGLGRLRPAT